MAQVTNDEVTHSVSRDFLKARSLPEQGQGVGRGLGLVDNDSAYVIMEGLFVGVGPRQHVGVVDVGEGASDQVHQGRNVLTAIDY